MDDDLKTLLQQAVAEIRGHFDVSNEDLRGDVRGVAEAVTSLDARFDREITSVRAEMRDGFSETQATFKFSHADWTAGSESSRNTNASWNEGCRS